MRIAIAADHNGLALKTRLIAHLTEADHIVDDRGTHGGDPSEAVDYPPLCADVCTRVLNGSAERGIVLGGSGLGETIVCNRFTGIRAGLCHDLWSTGISRGNNDSNVLVLAAKVVAPRTAEEIVTAWLTTPFKGGVHRRRLDQLEAIERSLRPEYCDLPGDAPRTPSRGAGQPGGPRGHHIGKPE